MVIEMKSIAKYFVLILLFSSIFTCAFNIQKAKAAETLIVPDNYPTIQAAINAASNGDTIFVRSGTYNENIVVNKMVTLIGENSNNTIINNGNDYAYAVVNIQSGNVTVENFTIQNGYKGVVIDSYFSLPDYIVSDRLINNTFAVESCSDNIVYNNTVINSLDGICADSFFCNVTSNIISCCHAGVVMDCAFALTSNTIYNCSIAMCINSVSHTPICHNNFVNDTSNFFTVESALNIWDNGYPSGGNYWSDYQTRYPNTTEIDGSDIWSIPYVVGVNNNNVDHYPLAVPWTNARSDAVITNVFPYKIATVVYRNVTLHVTLANQGEHAEIFNVTLYENSQPIRSTCVTLAPENTVTLAITLHTCLVGTYQLAVRAYNAYFSNTYKGINMRVLSAVVFRPNYLVRQAYPF
jgi:hypothetical protein